ncbi:MAG: hypothetical protein ACOYU5_07455 [Stygiobacter sp.]
MKNCLIAILLLVSSNYAQSIDTLNFSSTDSVDIQAIVQEQIKDALKKKSLVHDNEIQAGKVSLEIKSVNKTNNADLNLLSKHFNKLPLQYKIYFTLSVLIISFVLIKRTILQFKRKSTKKFKERITHLREEKIGGSIVNNKKKQIRLKLKDNPITFKQNEKEIALSAKQLNISKGELLLAARLKLLEVSKAQRSL